MNTAEAYSITDCIREQYTVIRSDVGTPHFFRVLRKYIEATIGFFDYVVTVNTRIQILRNINSEKLKGFDTLNNNSATQTILVWPPLPAPVQFVYIVKAFDQLVGFY